VEANVNTPLLRSWAAFRSEYRSREMTILSGWIRRGLSGTVVGLPGAGKSNLIGFLCHRPDVLPSYLSNLPVIIVPIDLNNMPAYDQATFYRVILRAFFEVQERFETSQQQLITERYRTHQAITDVFLLQSALRELLLTWQKHGVRIVLVFDRFDHFCQQTPDDLTNILRGLRDSFKDCLTYIVGMRQEIIYLADMLPLGELHEILDTNLCWVGAVSDEDAEQIIRREISEQINPLPSEAVTTLKFITGNYPSILKAACHWWGSHPNVPYTNWEKLLFMETAIQWRLQEIWQVLSQEEQQVVKELANDPAFVPDTAVLTKLLDKSLLRPATNNTYTLFSPLFARYARQNIRSGRGKLWLDENTNIIYQGNKPLDDLTPLPERLLRFLLQQPHVRHSYTDLATAVWPHEEVYEEGVAPDRLYQLAKELRRKIEPNPPQWRYILNWRGKPEGGYLCIPEGRPG
jgi:hypothetical protein